MRARLIVRLAAALATVLSAGCASMLPTLTPPELTVTAVQIAGGTADAQQVHLTLHAVNLNPREIRVRGIDVGLELSGQAFASGSTDAAFTLPASGATDFGVNLTANLNTAIGALLMGLGHHSVDYHLYGKVHLAGGLVREIPFDQRSRLRL